MISKEGDGPHKEEIQESNGIKLKQQLSLQISPSRRGLLNHENPKNGFWGRLNILPDRVKALKFSGVNLASPSLRFRQYAEERDEISRAVPSSSTGPTLHERFSNVFSQKFHWVSIRKMCKEWIRDPMNMALFAWILCVAISGAILFLVMIGWLNKALPKKSQRNAWFEVNNQILNALFTLMCLYNHPKRFYHLVLLCRWKPDDISRLRKVYCKNGTYKPHEWAHMMVVVILLHVNCFAQYALCGLNLGYKRSERPAIGVAICITFAIGAPAIAGVYTIVSPLGKEYDSENDEEMQLGGPTSEIISPNQLRLRSLEKRFSFALRDDQRIVESRPKWSGGILDIWDDISIAYLSLFCSFCVFGWNMERLGFGNMYVHIATFVLFCMAPFWIFILAAVNIDNETVREALGVTGIVLCGFGLLYGGFWRIQMRKRFKLPGYNFFCGKPAIADCVLWLCCCWCSLAQEVRTGDFYDIVEDKFYAKQTIGGGQIPDSPLKSGPSSPFGVGLSPTQITFKSAPSSPLRSPTHFMVSKSPSPSRFSKEYFSPDKKLEVVDEESSARGTDNTMTPPLPSLIHREEK